MARITVEDCLKKIPNRYEMVKLAAKRVKQLAIDGREPTVDPEDDKPTVIALREIAAGTVTLENIDSFNFDALEEELSDQLTSDDEDDYMRLKLLHGEETLRDQQFNLDKDISGPFHFISEALRDV